MTQWIISSLLFTNDK